MAKFNADFARQVLIEIEGAPPTNQYGTITDPNFSQEEISYHIKILAQDGLIDAKDTSSFAGISWKARSLTPQGHRFLDEIRDNSKWAQIKGTVSARAGELTWEAIKAGVVTLIGKSLA